VPPSRSPSTRARAARDEEAAAANDAGTPVPRFSFARPGPEKRRRRDAWRAIQVLMSSCVP
jgi:hypothetical protein